MSLVFLHTADWQLGKPFAGVDDDAKRHRLQEQRLQAIARLAEQVAESGAAFVLVAGDLFDSPQATKSTVSAACAAIGALKVPVLAIPGNHDHGGPGSLWDQEFFQRERAQLAPNLQLLLSPEPLVLEQAVIFPAPLLRRHEPRDPTAWIREALADPALPADLPRIVLAHGTIRGFGSVQTDDEGETAVANWIDLSRLPEEALDYIALGDWHGTLAIGPKAWYSGTPEIDRFPKGEGNRPGHVLKVTVSRGAPPLVEELRSGRFSWEQMSFRFAGDESLDHFTAQLDERIGSRAGDSLLLLELEGSLGFEAAARLEKILESWESRLLRLKLANRVAIAPTEDEIAALTRRVEDPLIAAVAKGLAMEVLGENEEAAIAGLALRELHAALLADVT